MNMLERLARELATAENRDPDSFIRGGRNPGHLVWTEYLGRIAAVLTALSHIDSNIEFVLRETLKASHSTETAWRAAIRAIKDGK